MSIKGFRPAFILLIIASTIITFVGYAYLGLVSEYRERNFLHMQALHELFELQDAHSILRDAEIEQAEQLVLSARGQAQWCLTNLNPIEEMAFRVFGAGPALAICEADISHADAALETLERLSEPEAHLRTGSESPFALGLLLQEQTQRMMADSTAFNPYVSIIETRVTNVVRAGTIVSSLAIGVIAIWLLRILTASIKDRERQAKRLLELAAISERANDCIVMTDAQGRATWVNPAFEKLTGYTLEEMVDKRPGEVLQGKDTDPATRRKLGEALRLRQPIKREILNYQKNGEPYWINLSISPLRDGADVHYGFVAISSDITTEIRQREALKEASQEIEHQAFHDALTNLANRRAFDSELESRKLNGESITLVRIDLDHFKYVNDTMGHAAGDHVLTVVADILRLETREGDLPARLGGDEFAVILGQDRHSEDAEGLAKRLLEQIKQPISFEGKPVRIGASFGVASASEGLLSNSQLVVGADAALYQAKEQGRNRVRLYTPELHREIEHRLDMARELKTALAEDEFVPFFQPQIDAQSRQIVGVETLARWQSPKFGLVMPDEFLPVAERLSMVDDIDAQIFHKAIEQIKSLKVGCDSLVKLSFNVTSNRIQDPKIVELVSTEDVEDLEIAFEILESVLVERQSDLFRFSVDALREAGILIEIDDFGSGHASIIGLMQLQPDALKIDRRLVSSITEAAVNKEVVGHIVEIARSMQVAVIAEGVETSEHADHLSELGCDVLQGYYFSRPLPIADLATFIDTTRKKPRYRA